MKAVLESSSQRLASACSRRCLTTPLFYIEEQSMRLDYLTRSFVHAAQNRINESERRLGTLSAKLDAMSPLKVLARGYSIPYIGSNVVKSVSDVSSGDKLSLRVSDGTVKCKVV